MSATFLSAFLLFQVQPMIAKSLLPWYGGSPAVWSTSMLFFQTLLLGGYAYAYFQAQRLPARLALGVHAALLLAAAACLPIAPDPALSLREGGSPQLGVLRALLLTVGLPYFLLSTTGPLLQAWFARGVPGRSPYPLYALSNLGSLLALLSYPFLVEPTWSATVQWQFWTLAFGALLMGLAYLAVAQHRFAGAGAAVAAAAGMGAGGDRIGGVRAAWVVLPALASSSLLAVTDRLTTDVAVVPFLWIAPLTVYLLSFILTFAERRFYFAAPTAALSAVLLLALPAMLFAPAALGVYAEAGLSVWAPTMYDSALLTTAVSLGLLFGVCMLCHGETVRLRPPPEELTGFYLAMASGGALGGLFVGVVAPSIFDGYAELHLVLVAGYLLAVRVYAHTRERGRVFATACMLLGAPVFALGYVEDRTAGAPALAKARNFYGVVSVVELFDHVPELRGRALYHGAVRHGYQLVSRPELPTTYYGPGSGVGVLLRRFPRSGPLKVGTIGLGIGTLAAYGRPGDVHRFYEINPLVVDLANGYFSYLSSSRARIELVVEDARVALDREPDNGFDVLVVDAFSGDSIPVHLLTREAFLIYRRHLRDGGALAFHLTNRYLDLVPVVLGLAHEQGMEARLLTQPTSMDMLTTGSRWVVVTNNPAVLSDPEIERAKTRLMVDWKSLPVWTDDFANLASRLR